MFELEVRTEYGKVILGSLGKKNLRPKKESESWIEYSQDQVSRYLNVDSDSVFCLNQIHGNSIIPIHSLEDILEFQSKTQDADALVTSIQKSVLVIRTADCVPIFSWGVKEPWVSLLHLGWKGARDNLLKIFMDSYCDPNEKIGFAMGPRIFGGNYEVDDEVARHFTSSPHIRSALSGGSGKYQLDLGLELFDQIKKGHSNPFLVDSGENCYKSADWFSHRAKEEGRNLHYIVFFASQTNGNW